jgi:hypothetical protein
MKAAVFKESGTLSCRGEVASSYSAGDIVSILDEFNEDIYEVMIMEGNSRGTIAYINKDMLELK